jgi:putative chitinase
VSPTIGQLIDAGVPPTQARLFLEPLVLTCTRFDIDTPARIGAFIGQCMVESANFTKLEENMTYRKVERVLEIFCGRVTTIEQAQKLVNNPEGLANCVYANRNGNGNALSGDGFRYRGRGLIQLTGRTNYANAAQGLGRPYLERPNMVGLPLDAAMTAGFYWHSNRLNYLADAWAIDSITKAINGNAMLHAVMRRQLSDEAVRAFA